MKPYHKIPTMFRRDPATNHKTLQLGVYATPELDYLEDNTWTFTEKVDGTNIRIVSYPDGDISFRGRTDKAQLPAPLVDRLRELFPPHGALQKQFPDGGCLYGEGYGAGIQSGGNYSATQEFVLFDVRVGNWWLGPEEIRSIVGNLRIHMVPALGFGTLLDMLRIVRDKDLKSAWGDFLAEGVVARPSVELSCRNGDRIITKLKAKDFH